MNDILPPKRPLNRTVSDIRPARQTQQRPVSPTSPPSAQQSLKSEEKPTPSSSPQLPAKKHGRGILWILLGIAFILSSLTIGAFLWYRQALTPINSTDKNKVKVEIVSGSSPDAIGMLLEDKKLIRSKLAFDIYTRMSDTRSKLQAGTYSLSRSESTEAIVAHMVGGKVEKLTITFLPGATLDDNKKAFIKAGFSENEVDEAFKKSYEHPLFADKPAETDLEGYIYGETYTFASDVTAVEILETTFDHYYDVITQNGLLDKFKQQKLDLYQAITLASIIQKEESKPNDQKQIAQVFLSRLAIGMPLGADPTYKYAAKKLGVEATPDLDSPYNTRKVVGLPPGPIASPGKGALMAVAHPSSGDYLYFLSGDDNVTYFAHTAEEHEANIQNHCQVKCSVF